MECTHYFSTDEAGPDCDSTKAELWGVLGVLVALKVAFAGAILYWGTDNLLDLSSLAHHAAMQWMLITVGLIAIPAFLLRKDLG
jgi:hypothetical protein